MMTHPGLAASLRARFAISTSERRQPVKNLGDCQQLGTWDMAGCPNVANVAHLQLLRFRPPDGPFWNKKVS